MIYAFLKNLMFGKIISKKIIKLNRKGELGQGISNLYNFMSFA